MNKLSKFFKVPLYRVNYSPVSGDRARLEYVETVIVINGLVRTVEEIITNYKDFTVVENEFVENCNSGLKLNNRGLSVVGASRNAHLVVLRSDINENNNVSEDDVLLYYGMASENKWVKYYNEQYGKKEQNKELKKK